MSVGNLNLVVSTETAEAEAALDRVKEKLQAVTAAAREARAAINALGRGNSFLSLTGSGGVGGGVGGG